MTAGARVIVIGGGIAGVSLAGELASDHSVTLLEAESVLAAHSTGRSASLYLIDYGPDAVREITAASEPLFEEFGTEPDSQPLLLPRGALMTAWDDASEAGLAMSLAQPQRGLEPVSATAARQLCPVLDTSRLRLAGYDACARDIDVMALHARYVRLLRQHDGEIVTAAPLIGARRGEQGWKVTSTGGRSWTADLLVNAGGAWGDQVSELCGLTGSGLTPRRRTVVISAPRSPVDPRWPIVADAAEAWYFKPEGSGLLLSPCDETPVPAGDAKPDPLDVAGVIEKVNTVTSLGLRSVSRTWAGLRTFAADRVPVVGPHPDDSSLFLYLGQGGYGVQMAPALARLGAGLIRDGRPPAGLQTAAEASAPDRLRALAKAAS